MILATVGFTMAILAASGSLAGTGEQDSNAGRSAPHDRMAFFEGVWELEPGGKPESVAKAAGQRETCAWLAGAHRHMICRTFHDSPAGRQQSMHILSYREHDATYVAYFAFSNGPTLIYHAKLDGDRWILEMQPTPLPNAVRVRTTITPTEHGMRFVEEGSENGGPWAVSEDYHYKRVTSGEQAVATATTSTSALVAAVPPSAPRERMSLFEGRWEFETASTSETIAKRTGRREVCDWLTGGRRHLVCLQSGKSANGSEEESISVLSYRGKDSTYIAYVALPDGHNVTYHGTPVGDGWVMTSRPTPLAPKDLRLRTTVTPTANGLRFVDERSTDGVAWEVVEDYRHRRVK